MSAKNSANEFTRSSTERQPVVFGGYEMHSTITQCFWLFFRLFLGATLKGEDIFCVSFKISNIYWVSVVIKLLKITYNSVYVCTVLLRRARGIESGDGGRERKRGRGGDRKRKREPVVGFCYLSGEK